MRTKGRAEDQNSLPATRKLPTHKSDRSDEGVRMECKGEAGMPRLEAQQSKHACCSDIGCSSKSLEIVEKVHERKLRLDGEPQRTQHLYKEREER